MADDLDRAKDIEMIQRDIALKKLQQRPPPETQQFDNDGNVICIECSEQIPEARLKAKPDAARCIDCKAAYELKRQGI